ncbi:chromosomal replication initiator DnaA [Pseudaminobacter arsenicus]|uniref:Chromosomal replication initiator DnaA n=1 Tax=Borborobacter arsenicus TaxID=1851146 RepID=A0A432V5C9_9HYPH|nr:helix-turn-helix domain-containing protein [Pseudaminobacter arsenicus]RUM97357.1 chromosomal replication initiator DnaA [Pseudaminobacter arsenicus]
MATASKKKLSEIDRITEPIPVASASTSSRRDERAVELCECMMDIVAALFNVSSKEMRRPGRTSQEVARVRQIAMYVTHVVLQMSMREVGRGFGRDRTTVVHACHLIEDMREDADFEQVVMMTERVALAAFRDRMGL